jgi:hypothetical protein
MEKPKRTVVAWKTYILKGQSTKMVLKKQDGRAWTKLNRLNMDTSG